MLLGCMVGTLAERDNKNHVSLSASLAHSLICKMREYDTLIRNFCNLLSPVNSDEIARFVNTLPC